MQMHQIHCTAQPPLEIVFSSVVWIAMAAAISLSYFHENNVFHRRIAKYKFLGHYGGLNENGLKKLILGSGTIRRCDIVGGSGALLEEV